MNISPWAAHLICASLLGMLPTLVLAQPADAKARSAGDWRAEGKQGAVAAGGAEAVAAGMQILQARGNAADAAVATVLALSVTDSDQFCFGGEVPFVLYDAKRGVVEVVCGQGAAPRLATREHFSARGGIPLSGLEPAAVPAVLGACVTVLDRFGTLRFADVAAPALAILDRHAEPWHADLAATLRRLIEAEESGAGDRRRGLRLVDDFFYRGPLARELSAWCEANGGLIRYHDLARHVTRVEEPVSVEYRGYQVYKCGVWSQGPMALQTLQLLSGFELSPLGHNQAQTVHLTFEAMKLALADRDIYYADPLYADVPLEQLLAPSYAEARRALIDPQKASLEQRPGDPRQGRPLLDEANKRVGLGGPNRDTTTCVTADAAGNMVAATPSGWSGVLAGKTGIWLGTRLQSFNIWKDHPNCIEPGKRPRITLTPTIVLKDNKPTLAISVAGGDRQDQTGLQVLLNAVDFGMLPAQAVTAERFATDHHLGSFGQTPAKLGSLTAYDTVDEKTIAELKRLGHRVKQQRGPSASPVMIAIDPRDGTIRAAGDPSAGRHAAAW
ncbi:MAG: gamma-glutamyltransferase [Planctomycetes bacterium]|nr:gamma-glutamyltransferase [Planctomycetota bacterium]